MKLAGFILALTVLSFESAQSSEAIGYYSDGKLKQGESILERGVNIHKLFMQRKRFYGTVEMNSVISDAVDFVRQEIPEAELIQVGDIANKEGGKCAEHASHQNGLDADIVYLTKSGKLQSQNAPYWEEDFVKSAKVSANFHVERNFKLFKYLVIEKQVDRIFVDAAIKKLFCEYAKSNNLKDAESQETLRRLRVEKLHSTHFHMRLKCGPTDYSCRSQAAIPAGNGC